MNITETLKTTGQIDFKIIRKDGTVEEWSVNNLITSAGKAQLALLAGDASAVPFTYLALGSGTTSPAVGQTTLVSEITTSGLARASANVSRVQTTVTNDTLRLEKTWTASGSVTVEEIGIFNDATTGVMLGRALTQTKSLVNGETITAIYKVIFA